MKDDIHKLVKKIWGEKTKKGYSWINGHFKKDAALNPELQPDVVKCLTSKFEHSICPVHSRVHGNPIAYKVEEIKYYNKTGSIEVEEHYSNGSLVKRTINGIDAPLDPGLLRGMQFSIVIVKQRMTIAEARALYGNNIAISSTL